MTSDSAVSDYRARNRALVEDDFAPPEMGPKKAPDFSDDPVVIEHRRARSINAFMSVRRPGEACYEAARHYLSQNFSDPAQVESYLDEWVQRRLDLVVEVRSVDKDGAFEDADGSCRRDFDPATLGVVVSLRIHFRARNPDGSDWNEQGRLKAMARDQEMAEASEARMGRRRSAQDASDARRAAMRTADYVEVDGL